MAGGCGETEGEERGGETGKIGRKEKLLIPDWEFIHHWNQCVL